MIRGRLVGNLLLVVAGILSLLPVYELIYPGSVDFFQRKDSILAMFFLSWALLFAVLCMWVRFTQKLEKPARQLGIDTRIKSINQILDEFIFEIERKNKSIISNIIERKIWSREQLSMTLQEVVNAAYKLLSAESAELALFDKESGLYHSSFVVGKPFRASAQAMLSGAIELREEDSSPDVLVQPITFAGSVLGTLRVGMKRGVLPSIADREVIKLLAVQGSLAIINAQYTHELVRMKKSSEESVRAKTGFLANLSHEIRGPLGIMLNAVELVIDGLCGQVTEDQLETLQMVQSNGQHLLELINDVLDYAKVEAGKLVASKTTILLDEILKDIAGVIRGQAESKNHKVQYIGNKEALAISCDRRHLRQMLINLLTNAIKYTPDGGLIKVWAERVPGNKVRISVQDSGVGIAPKDRARVFSAFERIDNSYSVTQIGAGLGMPLTKRLAEVNGGAIDFESEEGKGSHFWLTFPAQKPAEKILQEETKTPQLPKGKGEVVLIIEREDGERKMLQRFLNHVGFNSLAVKTRLEAIEVFRTRKVNLVIIDNNVIDSVNESLVESLRKELKDDSIPFILITSRAFVFDIEKYLKSGVDRCLVKPVELDELSQTCRELLDGTYSGEVVDEAALDIKKAAKPSKEAEQSGIHTRIVSIDDIVH